MTPSGNSTEQPATKPAAKPDVLVMSPLRPEAMALAEAAYTLHRHDTAPDPGALLAQVGGRCEAIITSGNAPLDRATIAALPALRVVCSSSAGYETIDVDALSERGIVLTNTSAALLDDVADTALMLLLAAWRDLIAAHAWTVSGDWGRKGAYPLQSSLRGKRLGIVGLGNVGQAIAARCVPFGLETAYYGRREKPQTDLPYFPDLVALAAWADILVLSIAGGEATRNLVDAPVLEALGPRGLLVSVARGSVVDEPALIAALREGRLGRAGLDVFWNEPNPDPELTGLPKVTLYPHHASGTVETRDAMAHLVVENLAAHFAGRPLLTPAN